MKQQQLQFSISELTREFELVAGYLPDLDDREELLADFRDAIEDACEYHLDRWARAARTH